MDDKIVFGISPTIAWLNPLNCVFDQGISHMYAEITGLHLLALIGLIMALWGTNKKRKKK